MQKFLNACLTGFTIILTSCSTIEINESDVFDVKRTIHTEDFNQMPYRLEETRINTPTALD